MLGGAGQIGSHLVVRLVERGAHVVVLDRVVPPEGRGMAPAGVGPQVEMYQCDISDADQIEEVNRKHLKDIDHVVHLAARISNSASPGLETIGDFQSDIAGTALLFGALPPIRSCCFASSIMVYGSARSPLIDELHPTEPENTYGVLKLACEQMLRVFAREKHFALANLRLSSVYGLSVEGTRAIPSFLRAVMRDESPVVSGDGSVKRDYLYIDDAVEAILLALATEADGVFNIGSGVGTSVLDLAHEIIRASGKGHLSPQVSGAHVSAASQATLVYDIGKAKRELGFNPGVDLAAGLKKLVAKAGP